MTDDASYLKLGDELLDAVGERVSAEDEDAAVERDGAAVVPGEDAVDAVERPAGAHVVQRAEHGPTEHQDLLPVGQQEAVVAAKEAILRAQGLSVLSLDHSRVSVRECLSERRPLGGGDVEDLHAVPGDSAADDDEGVAAVRNHTVLIGFIVSSPECPI